MKNNRSIAIGVAFFSVIVIIVMVVSLLNVQTPNTPADPGGTAVTLTPDPCARENVPTEIAEMEKLTREFDDIYSIAAITPSTQLTPLITDLSRVRRSAEDFQVPACLLLLKEYQVGEMNAYIEAMLTLVAALTVQVNPLPGMTQQEYDQAMNEAVSQYYALANQHLQNAAGLENKYAIEKARLLGVTLVPTPTTVVIPSPITTTTPAP
jgi:hypothetical protein